MSDVFYGSGETVPAINFGVIPQFEVDEMTDSEDGAMDEAAAFDSSFLGTLALRMRVCPEPLPMTTTGVRGRMSPCSFDWSIPVRPSQDTTARWVRGWHGTSAYALFAILYEQHLRAGPLRRNNSPAVYQYLDSQIDIAESESCWVPLFNDGYFYRFVFETRTDVNHSCHNSGEKNSQIYGHPDSTHLFALHVQRRNITRMMSGDAFYECWDPRLEMCPKALRAKQERLRQTERRALKTSRADEVSQATI